MHSRDRGLLILLSMFLFSILLVGGGLLVANQSYTKKVRERWLARQAANLGELAIVVPLIDGRPDWTDPFAPEWERATTLEVQVAPQNLAMPVLTRASVRQVLLETMTDGRVIAWRLTWQDPGPDMNIDTGRFCDAAALQFAVGADASYMMGGPNQPVQILHWKAIWQHDVDDHFQDVQDLHPNYWADLYWFAEGEFPYPVPEAFTNPVSRQWFPALAADNPLSAWNRTQPVEELSAEGFGTLTHQPRQATVGRGIWHDGHWTVVMARPLVTNDAADFQFRPGKKGRIGIAVWEGASGNVGGRKHYSQWIDFKIESPQQVALGDNR
jgi:hypothetical protein